VGGRPGRSPNGGSGNGTGGDGITWNPNTSETPGNTATNGVGGAGATAIFDADGYDLTSTGGSGGAVGATDDVSASVSGGTGGAGEDAPSVSPVGGGGGGGGAGVFISISNSTQTVASTVTITGGQGGQGGAADGESNFDPGAGGGGGAGVIIGAGANIVTFTNNGTLTGGRGGTGGYGGYAGSGGGGGDGLLVLGAGARVTNGAGATISGGAGGAPGAFQDGENLPGGYGGGGAGVNLVGVGATLTNSGTITGGGAGVSPVAGTSAQNGTPGVGVRAWGGAIVDDSGAIAGGSNSSTQADAVLFSGGGNQLVIESGASFTGNIVSTSGSDPATGDTLTLGGNANGSFNVSQDVGFANNTKIGDITWTLTGTGNAGINWTIQQGELVGTTSTFNGSITFASNGLGLSPTLDFDQATSGTFADVISGAGEVFKDGAGTVTLAGANTYTGGTTINAGTLQGDTTSLQGNITDNAALVFNQDTNGSYSGVISGVGTLTKTGTGSVTLLGTNTYTGGTTIAEGTLQVGTSSLQGNIANNAALVFDQTSNGTYSGVISGSGALSKAGTGTVTLAGSNTYTGGTTISAGTLQGDTTSLQGNIIDNAALVFNQAASGTYTGTISGIGTLSKAGTGTVTLAGSNTYTGGTTISAGTLQGDTTSLQGNIIDNAALVFNQTANGTYAGTISGTGTLTKDDSGTLTLAGSNTYTGGTTISAGTLQGDTTSLQGNILNNTALVFDQTSNGTYSGVISGSGTLTTNGTGTLILDGANTSTGLTTVASGSALVVGDSSHTAAALGGDASVNGGTLAGFGTVQGSATLSNGATLAPGQAAAVGTLTIQGDLTIGSGSQLNFDFGAPGANFSTPGQSDRVVVGGNLSIDSSTLNVNNLGSMGPGLYNLFNWGNSLTITGGGFAPPSGMTLQILTVDKQINLVDTQGLTLDEWDANGQAGPGAMGGGSGTWSVFSDT